MNHKDAHICTLLLVDDEPAHRLIIRRGLGIPTKSIILHEAETLEMARMLLASCETLDAVLVDLRLGQDSGIDLVKDLRQSKKWRDTPVLVLSTSQLSSEIEAAYAAGASCFLVKSAEPAEFQTCVQQALRYFCSGKSPRARSQANSGRALTRT